MTQIKVELVKSCCDDLDTVNAARVSFDKESKWVFEDGDGGLVEVPATKHYGEDLSPTLSKEDTKLIKYLAAHKHMTPFRHNFIKLRVKAPIFLARQLGKHQAGLSWNEVSRRYVDSEPEFYVPEVWRGKPEGSIKQGSADEIEDNDFVRRLYKSVIIDQSLAVYQSLMKDLNVAPEMARMVLPQSMMTEWIWSGNLLAFAHVYKERINSGAQLEAQEFAKELDAVIRPLAPVSWSALVGES